MAAEEFDSEMVRLIRARPFRPFTILMVDGREVVLDVPKAAINAGGAGLIDADGEIQFIECDQVRGFRLTNEELAK